MTHDEATRIGLCANCKHARKIVSAKDSVFYQCNLAKTDSRWTAYPPLPVRECAGYQAK